MPHRYSLRMFRSLSRSLPLALARAALAGCVIAGAGSVAPRPVNAQAALNAPSAQLESLIVVTTGGQHKFQVEVARTDEQRARGLMFRKFMPADRGMLFDFKAEQPIMMWMRNTYIPLDMIFIARDGRVINVAENTEPLSERTIASAAPAFAVLEVNAGVARKIGLKPGDRIEHSLFRR